jgi:serine/threonine-protein kinase
VPSVLDAVVTRALDMRPADRYPTALEFVANLEVAVPPAAPREVAAWVAAVAGAKLAERRKLMVDMPTATVEWPATAAAAPLATPVVKPRAATLAIWIGAVAVLLLGGIALASSLGFSRRRADPTTPVTSTSAVAVASQSAPPPPADTAPVQDPTAEAPPPAPASRARPNRSGRAAVPPPPASSCNPPFTIDGNGVKRFKPDCF